MAKIIKKAEEMDTRSALQDYLKNMLEKTVQKLLEAAKNDIRKKC